MKLSNTPYDDVFRTLLNDCSSLIIPVINEIFWENYSGKEKIIFSPNEHFLNRKMKGLQTPVSKYWGRKQRNISWNVKAVRITACWSDSSNMILRLRLTEERLQEMYLPYHCRIRPYYF